METWGVEGGVQWPSLWRSSNTTPEIKCPDPEFPTIPEKQVAWETSRSSGYYVYTVALNSLHNFNCHEKIWRQDPRLGLTNPTMSHCDSVNRYKAAHLPPLQLMHHINTSPLHPHMATCATETQHATAYFHKPVSTLLNGIRHPHFTSILYMGEHNDKLRIGEEAEYAENYRWYKGAWVPTN